MIEGVEGDRSNKPTRYKRAVHMLQVPLPALFDDTLELTSESRIR